jgi:hypothetical protein
VRFDVYRTAAVLEQNQGSQRANAFLISFCKKALPRLELVAKNTSARVSTATYQPLFSVVILIPAYAISGVTHGQYGRQI